MKMCQHAVQQSMTKQTKGSMDTAFRESWTFSAAKVGCSLYFAVMLIFFLIKAASGRTDPATQRNMHADKPATGVGNSKGITSSATNGPDSPSNINVLLSGETSGMVKKLTPISQDVPLSIPRVSNFHTNLSNTRKLSRDRRPFVLSVFQTNGAIISNPPTRDFQAKQGSTGNGHSIIGNRRVPLQSFFQPPGKPEELNPAKTQASGQIFSLNQNSNKKPGEDGSRTRYGGQAADHSTPVHVGLSNNQMTQVRTLPADPKPTDGQAKSVLETKAMQGNSIHLSIRKRPGIVEQPGPNKTTKSTTASPNPHAEAKPNDPPFRVASKLMVMLENDLVKAKNDDARNEEMKWVPPTGMQDAQKAQSMLQNTKSDVSQLSGDKVLAEMKTSGNTKTGEGPSPLFILEEELVSAVRNEAGNAEQNPKLNRTDSSQGSHVGNERNPALAVSREKQSEASVLDRTEMPSDERSQVSTSSKNSLSGPQPGVHVNDTPAHDDMRAQGGAGLNGIKPIPASEQQPLSANTHDLSLKGDSIPGIQGREKQPSLGQHPKEETKMEASAPSGNADSYRGPPENVLHHFGMFLGPLRQAREEEMMRPREMLSLAKRHRVMRRFLHPPHGHHIGQHG